MTAHVTDIEPLARKWIEGVIAGSPVGQALGVEVAELQTGLVSMRLPFDEQLTTMPDIVHGGVVATLVDMVGAAASASGVTPADAATGGATTHLSVTYLAPASGDLTAAARVVHRTRSTTQSEVSVHGAGGRLVAIGQVSSRIFH